jgi:hypothetical protein
MGAGASKAPPDITAKSLEAKRITQEIFRFMVTQMKFEEYLALANPDQCKKYVILIADSLQKFFAKIKIVPDKTKDGYIYFRKFDDVKGATPMSAQYCTVIALFYVRIFQIYGALALSILDTDTNVYEFAHGGGLDELEAIEDAESVQTGGALPLIPEEPLRSGEALPGIYNALTPFLSRIRGDNTFYKFTGKYMLLSMNPTIFAGQQQYGMQFMYERGTTTYGTIGKYGQIICYMRMEPTDKGIKLILSGITIKEEKRKDIRLEDSTIRLTRKETVMFGVGQYGNIAEILNERFLDILRQGTREREEEDDDDYDRRGEKRYDYAGRPIERKDDSKVREQFRTLALLDRLKKMDSQPIKAHCIARALQLVSPRGLQKEFPQTIISSICDSKFYSAKDKRYPQSLPAMDEKILESRGIYTLWQLFFDKVLPDMSPDMSDATRAKYAAASAYLSKAFGQTERIGFKDITAKTGQAYCAGKKDKQLQVQSKEAIQALRSVVGKMIETQALHTANVMKLLGKLFLIQPGKPIQLHPNVLEGGLPAVNAIGEQARALLVAYYTNCEGLYGTGIQVIERSKAKIIERFY